MIPVMQTRDGWPRGNCLMACVASVLEVPLDTLPDLREEAEQRGHEDWWWGVLLETLAAYGYGVTWLASSACSAPRGYAIASVGRPDAPGHAVVVLDGQIVHDPHPLRPSRWARPADVRGWYVLTPVPVEAAA